MIYPEIECTTQAKIQAMLINHGGTHRFLTLLCRDQPFWVDSMIFHFFVIELTQKGVGKEMPISRIVVAVPNATVVLLD
jgi:hypothetical protein